MSLVWTALDPSVCPRIGMHQRAPVDWPRSGPAHWGSARCAWYSRPAVTLAGVFRARVQRAGMSESKERVGWSIYAALAVRGLLLAAGGSPSALLVNWHAGLFPKADARLPERNPLRNNTLFCHSPK